MLLRDLTTEIELQNSKLNNLMQAKITLSLTQNLLTPLKTVTSAVNILKADCINKTQINEEEKMNDEGFVKMFKLANSSLVLMST